MDNSPYGYQAVLEFISSLERFVREYDDMIAAAIAQNQAACRQIESEHEAQLKAIAARHRKNISVVQGNSARLIGGAEAISRSVEEMDAYLLQVDKYYRKYTEPRAEAFKEAAIKKYGIGAIDHLESLQKMEEEHATISRKYTEEMLPVILNGLDYLFSKSRKKDYEELAMLKIGVGIYLQQVKEEIPSITRETVEALTEDTTRLQQGEEKRYTEAMYHAKEQNAAMMGAILENLRAEIHTLFHDKIVEKMAVMTAMFGMRLGQLQNEPLPERAYFYFQWIRFPLQIQSPFLRKTVMDKFQPLIVGDEILFPCAIYFDEYLPYFLPEDTIGTRGCQQFVYSMMYTLMSLMPVGSIEFNVLDERGHGNNVSLFFDVKKMLPALFDNDLCVTHDQVVQKIRELDQYVEHTVQNTLGTRYASIFEYAQSTGNDLPKLHLLVCFGFPNGLDEKTLSDLNNIIVHGARCGIITVLVGSSEPDRMSRQAAYVDQILACCDWFGAGMRVASYLTVQLAMPERAVADVFAARYLLAYEGIQNRGIAFMSLVSRLLAVKEEKEMDALFQELQARTDEIGRIGSVPEEGAVFPEALTVGVIHYPQNVFEGAYVEDRLVHSYGEREGTLALPYSFDLVEQGNLMLEGSERDVAAMHAFVSSMIWCFISSMPVTKASVDIIDIKRRGSGLGSLMTMIDKIPSLFGDGICTGMEQIAQKLSRINEEIDERIQKKLVGVHPNILSYNKATPKRAEICHLLVIYDFPSGFENRSMKLLESILENGPRCGIYAVICYDPSIKMSRYDANDEQIEMMKKCCQVITAKAGVLSLRPFDLRVEGLAPVSAMAQERFTQRYAETAQKINRTGIMIDDVLDAAMFARNSVPQVEIPIGIGDGGRVVEIEIGGSGSSHHLLIGGGTGGGKSTLMHTIIMSTMLHYRPEDISLYLLDFKGGVEFKIYDTYRLPHIRLLAVDAMQEFGASILEHIIVELNERSELCKKTVPQSTGLVSYRANKTEDMPDMPRILLIMDEFQILYNDATNRRVAHRCAQLTKRIVTEGRAYGIHLIMATQSMNILRNLPIEGGTIEQMRIRIGLKCGEADAKYLFSFDKADDAMKRMVGPVGTAVMNHDYTEEDNTSLRVAYCSKDRQTALLEQIQDSLRDCTYQCQTFEGSAKTFLLDHLRESGISVTDARPCVIHMGTKIEVAPPFTLEIDRRRKHDMMICGSNNELTDHIVKNYLISAVLDRHPRIYCIDGEVLIGEPDAEQFYQILQRHTDRLQYAVSNGDAVRMLLDLRDISAARKKKRSIAPVFLLIKHMQYLELIQQMLRGETVSATEYLDEDDLEDTVPAAPAAPSEAESHESFDMPVVDENEEIPEAVRALMGLNSTLIKHEKVAALPQEPTKPHDTDANVGRILIDLIVNGPSVGIYCIVTSSDVQTLRENMRGYENTFNKFQEIIAHSMSDEDANFLISDVQTSSMPENVAYFYDGVNHKFQFKPYVSPSAEELEQFLNGCDLS